MNPYTNYVDSLNRLKGWVGCSCCRVSWTDGSFQQTWKEAFSLYRLLRRLQINCEKPPGYDDSYAADRMTPNQIALWDALMERYFREFQKRVKVPR